MPMIKMNARRRFKLDGHLVEEGQEVEVPSTYARALEARGEAAPQAPIVPAAAEKRPKKGQYKTRVMAAEPTAPAPEAHTEEFQPPPAADEGAPT